MNMQDDQQQQEIAARRCLRQTNQAMERPAAA
jgi:hypothetical protein